jgi:lipopolysaccharide export system permease protein
MRTIYLYVAREVISPFFLGLFVITFVMLMFQLLQLTELVVNYGVSIVDVGRLILYWLPPFFVFTVPMSFLLAVLVAFERMSVDSELTALRASGVSLFQLYPVVCVLSVLVTAAALYLTVVGEPWGKRSFKEFLFEQARSKATVGLKEQVFNEEFDNLVIYVDRVDAKKNRLKRVFVADERNPEQSRVFIAREGSLVPNPHDLSLVLRLSDGTIHPRGRTEGRYDVVRFKTFDVNLALGSDVIRDTKKTYLEMDLGELEGFLAAREKDGPLDREYFRARVELQKKFAFPFAAIVFGVLGVPLVIKPVRSGRSLGFVTALAILVAYYLMFRMGETIGWQGTIHPAILMWAPNVLLGAFGAWMFWKKASEADARATSWLDRLIAWVRGLWGGGGR